MPSASCRTGLAGARAEQVDIAGQSEPQALRDPRNRIVVAEHDEDRALAEALHLAGEKHAGAVVVPVAIVEVARDHDEGHVLVEGKLHHRAEGAAGGVADQRRRRRVGAREAGHRAVEMDVGGVEELHVRE